MYKSKSIPINLNRRNEPEELNEKLLSKSPSYDNLEKFKEITIVFEGDGPLGIRFKNVDEKMVVSKVDTGTVADEYYELKEEMVADMINGHELKYYTYNKMINLLKKYWINDSRVNIRFKDEIVYNYIYYFLEELGCEVYYDKFIKLGARDKSDLEYIEYDDLLKMNMEGKDINKVSRRLGLTCNLVIPKNESMVFEYESPKKMVRENENIDMLRSKMFRNKEKELF